MQQSPHIAVIGSGPATVFLLIFLSRQGAESLSISIFESSEALGKGTPFREENCGTTLLSNLSVDEVPELLLPFTKWCSNNHISIPQQQVPRYLIGQYFHWNFVVLFKRFPNARYYTKCKVQHVKKFGETYHMVTTEGSYSNFTHLVINTGHTYECNNLVNTIPAYPLTHSVNKQYRNYRLIGSSMSAIDCCIRAAELFGHFENVQGVYRFNPKASFSVTMYSPSGALPHLFYPSIDMRKQIRRLYTLIRKKNPGQQISLDYLFNQFFKPILSEKCSNLYAQIAHFSLEETIAFINRSFEGIDGATQLKVAMLVNDSEFSRFQGIMEVFSDTLYVVSSSLTQRDFLFFKQTLYPFLTKLNGALPQETAKKLYALFESGHLRLSRMHISDTSGFSAKSRWIDCRGVGSFKTPNFIKNLEHQGIISLYTEMTNRNVLTVDVDDEYQANGFNKSSSNIYIGASTLLSAKLLSLPGLAVTARISFSIAKSLAKKVNVQNKGEKAIARIVN